MNVLSEIIARKRERLREAQATGTTSKGATPTLERRKRGLLEGIF